ncbi:hypothetical protein [Duganella hordei]|uniref:hypothetical protein n=1 Tax=Duganella hordei TaxID=2865934 RepID=UPI0030E89451
MPDITREEIDAKTAAAEAKSQTQFAILNGKFDAVLTQFNGKLDAVSNQFNDRLDAVTTQFDTKLDTLATHFNARIDAMAAQFNGKLDAMAAQLNGRLDAMAARLDGHGERIDALEHAVGSLKTTVIVTGISSVIAIVFGVATFNATLLSNMTATFQAGKDVATTQAEVQRQVEATAALLRRLEREHPPSSPPQK